MFWNKGGSPRISLKTRLALIQITAQELNNAWNAFGAEFEWHEIKDTYGRGGINTIQRLRDKHHVWQRGGLNDLIPCAINAGLMGLPKRTTIFLLNRSLPSKLIPTGITGH